MSANVESKLYQPSPLEGVEFLSKGITPPSNVYIGKDDVLFVRVYCSQAAQRVDVRGRLLLANGRITLFETSIQPTSDGIGSTVLFPLGEGWLLNVTAFNPTAGSRRGECFAVVGIAAGRETSHFKHTILLQGYVTISSALMWPGSILQSSVDGPGAMREFIGTDQAAGNEINDSLPAGRRWRLMALSATLTTSATVAARRPQLQILGVGQVAVMSPVNGTVPASTVAVCTWVPGVAHDTNFNPLVVSGGIPANMILKAAATLATSTLLFQAGDNWGPMTYLVEEWLEPTS